MISDFWNNCYGFWANDLVLSEAMRKVCLLWSNRGKVVSKQKRLALGSGCSARLILSLLISEKVFFLHNTDSWWLTEPRKHNVYSIIHLISSIGRWVPEERASCKEHKGPVVYKKALWITAISLSWTCTYLLDWVYIWFKIEGSMLGITNNQLMGHCECQEFYVLQTSYFIYFISELSLELCL